MTEVMKIQASLTSTGSSNKLPRTKEEKETAKQTVLVCFEAADQKKKDGGDIDVSVIHEETVAAFKEVLEETDTTGLNLQSLCRAVYKTLAEAKGHPERAWITVNGLLQEAVIKADLLSEKDAKHYFKSSHYVSAAERRAKKKNAS